jgi:hypothetical protein
MGIPRSNSTHHRHSRPDHVQEDVQIFVGAALRFFILRDLTECLRGPSLSLEHVQVIAIPDRKTPPDAFVTCDRLADQGLRVVCATLDEQEMFLNRIGLSTNVIIYNSNNRRNVGRCGGSADRSFTGSP